MFLGRISTAPSHSAAAWRRFWTPPGNRLPALEQIDSIERYRRTMVFQQLGLNGGDGRARRRRVAIQHRRRDSGNQR